MAIHVPAKASGFIGLFQLKGNSIREIYPQLPQSFQHIPYFTFNPAPAKSL
jgi:hypothetical protein